MAEGVDYSFARPGGAALAAAGKVFAVRYLWPGGGKGLTASELANLRANGIEVPVVFESSSGRALDGRAAGNADAVIAQGQLDALGMGALPVYFAVDFNAAQAQEMAAIDQYLTGAGDVLGVQRVGVYGGLAVVQHVQSSGTAAWLWQTYAWSAGRVADGIHLYQYRNGQTINGGAVDFCRSMSTEYGQHPVGPHPDQGDQTMMKAIHVPAGVGSPEMWGIIIPGNSRQITVDWPVDQSTRTANLDDLQAAQNVGGTVEFPLTVVGKELFAAAIAAQNKADRMLAALVPVGSGGSVDLTPILAAISALDTQADGYQTALVQAIQTAATSIPGATLDLESARLKS